jgi:hypothetical protein
VAVEAARADFSQAACTELTVLPSGSLGSLSRAKNWTGPELNV